MLASQFLYTSWENGNSTTKGYMVYSQTEGITRSEVADVQEAMKYERPNDDTLPLNPTNEEIDALYPKSFGYFKLPNGKFCISRSTYVGFDYSGRRGNYLLHGYILDDIGDLIPSRMINSDIFRSRLTREEFNIQTTPDPLPRVELGKDLCSILTEDEVRSFFNSRERVDTLKTLAQAVCRAIEQDGYIELCDDLSNMHIWVTALSMILPQSMLKKFYFITYDTNSSSLVTLSCKQASNSSGKAVIESPTIDVGAKVVGSYFDVVCDKLTNDYYEGILCASNVSKIMDEYGCTDCETAYNLSCVLEGNLDRINSNDELMHVLKHLEAHNDSVPQDTYDTIFSKYSSKDLYKGDQESINVFKCIYPHIASEAKADLLMMYVDFKLATSGSPSDQVLSIKKDCPCDWGEATKCFLRQSFRDHLQSRPAATAELLMCASWINIYEKCSDEQRVGIYENICRLYTNRIGTHDLETVRYILEECRCMSSDLYKSVYLSPCKNAADALGCNARFLFDYLSICIGDTPDSMFWTVFINELDACPEMQDEYMHKLIDLKKYMCDDGRWDELLRVGSSNNRVGRIIGNLEIYEFETQDIRNSRDLADAYEKYALHSRCDDDVKEKFKSLFHRKVKLLLSGLKPKECIKFAADLYEGIGFDWVLSNGDKKVIDLLIGSIYNDDSKSISLINKSLTDARSESLALRAAEMCGNAGIPVYPRLRLICEGYTLITAVEKHDGTLKKSVQDGALIFANGNCQSCLVEEFTVSYIEYVLKTIYMLYNENDDLTPEYLIEHLLAPLHKSNKKFDDKLMEALKRDIPFTNDNMDVYFIYIFDTTGTFRNKIYDIIEKYLSNMGKGKRNALFNQLTDYFGSLNDSTYSRKMSRYITSFNQSHVSIWDTIKSIFSVKGKKNKNGSKK